MRRKLLSAMLTCALIMGILPGSLGQVFAADDLFYFSEEEILLLEGQNEFEITVYASDIDPPYNGLDVHLRVRSDVSVKKIAYSNQFFGRAQSDVVKNGYRNYVFGFAELNNKYSASTPLATISFQYDGNADREILLDMVSIVRSGESPEIVSPLSKVRILRESSGEMPDTWDVTFHMNDGSEKICDILTVEDGDNVDKPADPEREGYEFGGWYTDRACRDEYEYDFEAPVIADLDLYAKWTKKGSTPNDYNVTFHLNDGRGTIYASGTVAAGQTVTQIGDPGYGGYEFGGWYTDKACSDENKYDFGTPVYEDLDLYAKWDRITSGNPDEHSVYYFMNNGTIDVYRYAFVKDGEPAVKPQAPQREYYVFEGWYTDAACDEPDEYDFDLPVTEDLDLYAKWSKDGGSENPDEHTVYYFKNDGTTDIYWREVVKDGEVATKPADPVRSGYRFVDWYSGPACTDEELYDFAAAVDWDLDLYAKWQGVLEPEEYGVTFHLNDGSGEVYRTATVEAGNLVDRPADPSRDGYNFGGWYTDQSCSDGNEYDFSSLVYTDLDLFAKWSETESNGNGGSGSGSGGGSGGGGGGTTATASYTITYHPNNGTDEESITESRSSGATVTVRSGSIFTAPEGTIFAGWSTSSDGLVTYAGGFSFTMPANNMDLYAVWEDPDVATTVDLAALLNYEDHYAYIVGYEDGTVKPNATITREEVATIFFRLLTDEAREQYRSTTNNFGDVSSGRWSNIAISTLTGIGVLSGDGNGNFRPSASITRAELATIAAQFSSAGSGGSMFSDVTNHWAEEYIVRAERSGWLSGYNDGTFRPDELVTRAETVVMINRVTDRDADAEGAALSGMTTFTDNGDPGVWYYYAIQEATNSHYYTIEDGVGQWTALRENRDWIALERPGTIIGTN